jgi:hypothetical protein
VSASLLPLQQRTHRSGLAGQGYHWRILRLDHEPSCSAYSPAAASERKVQTSETLIQVAMIRLLVARLGRRT